MQKSLVRSADPIGIRCPTVIQFPSGETPSAEDLDLGHQRRSGYAELRCRNRRCRPVGQIDPADLAAIKDAFTTTRC